MNSEKRKNYTKMRDLKHLSGNNWRTCVFLHVCFHVCVQCIDLCVHAGTGANVCCGVGHVKARGKWLVSPSKRSLYFLSQVLSVTLRLTDLARLTDQWISWSACLCFPVVGLHMPLCPGFMWVLETQISSCIIFNGIYELKKT